MQDVSLEYDDTREYRPSAWALNAVERMAVFKWVLLNDENPRQVVWKKIQLAHVLETALPPAAVKAILDGTEDVALVSKSELRRVKQQIHDAKKISQAAKARKLLFLRRRLSRTRKTFAQFVVNLNHKTPAEIMREITAAISKMACMTFNTPKEMVNAVDGILGVYILKGYLK